MATGAIVALVLTIVGALGILVYVLLQKGKLKLPEGVAWTANLNGFKTTLVKAPKARLTCSGDILAKRCCTINQTVSDAFKIKNIAPRQVLSKCKEIVVYIMDDETFDHHGGNKWVEYYSGAAATVTKCGRKFFGASVPMVCLRDKHGDKITKTGEPVIHELCHAYLDDYVADSEDHSDPKVWVAAGGDSSAQAWARAVLCRDSL